MDKAKKTLMYEGKNVEEAIQAALSDLKLSRDQVQIKIVCEESKGLFGMNGLKPAKIKVLLKKRNAIFC
ncbi:MAG: hypothetical protein EOM23_10680 [Candidatus Moranbacteria bacterium]|nr:hypothetical protein [Candidatus Moranbacteria bacterium]